MTEQYQKIVAGKVFDRRKAVLKNFRKVTSATCFPFITPFRGMKVEGYLLSTIDAQSLQKIDKYESEGDLYWRRSVEVFVDEETVPVNCDVYVGNVKSIRKYFMPGTDIDDRIEKYVESEIDEILIKDSIKGRDFSDAVEQNRIIKEMFGSTVEEIVKEHVSRFNMSLNYLTKRLKTSGIPSLDSVKNNPEIVPYADNYIRFAVRHIIFNQIEDKVRESFAGAVKTEQQFYEHTISVMLSLEFMNQNTSEVDAMMVKYKADIFDTNLEYSDYVDKAIKIADAIYNRENILQKLEEVKRNRNVGSTPLGAEAEFSTIGRYAVQKERPHDPEYNDFRYFHDFDFTRRLWKLGGHIDDHRYPPSKARSHGFLEYAFGRFRIYGDLSKPVTQDPWILNRLINSATKFSRVRPHSLHISIQANDKIDFDKKNKIENILCLLLLGGDFGYDNKHRMCEKRIANKEIIDKFGLLNFSLENVHYSDEERINKNTVIEYQFPRLYYDTNYQPLILALKGYQLAENTRPLCPFENTEKTAYSEMDEIKRWACSPTPVTDKDINNFLKIVEEGLMSEANGRPSHKITYIRKNITEMSVRIRAKNKFIKSTIK